MMLIDVIMTLEVVVPQLTKKLGKAIAKCEMCHSSSYRPRNMYVIEPHGAVADLVEDYKKKICTKCYNGIFSKKK